MVNQEDKRIDRAPVIVIMGHIDHGKSTLLDYIRSTNITESEAGGITQHISAYEVHHKGQSGDERTITFLDTPGHEAFSQMRSRGANVADIAILIVSAEDGVKTQTLEALSSIKEARIPFVVAINKIDKPGADIEKTKASLIENEIYIEGMGGDIPWVAISSKSGEGVSELMDLLLLATDLEELKGDVEKNGEGIVVESHIEKTKGVSATLIIKDGTLKSGMYVVIGNCIAPVRIMENFLGKKIKEASFSSPIRIIGFNNTPEVGSTFVSYDSKKEAETAMKEHKEKSKKAASANKENGDEDEANIIPIIIKADVLGTIEAIKHEIEKIKNDRVEIRIVQEGAGNITENDVKSAGGKNNTLIVGFNVSTDSGAKDVADRAGIKIETFSIIYELAEWLEKAVKERTPIRKEEEITGRIKVLKIFNKTKDKRVFGGRVESGNINVGDKIKITNKDGGVGVGKITGLQLQKVSVTLVTEGNEFGGEIQSTDEISPGDILESFIIVEK